MAAGMARLGALRAVAAAAHPRAGLRNGVGGCIWGFGRGRRAAAQLRRLGDSPAWHTHPSGQPGVIPRLTEARREEALATLDAGWKYDPQRDAISRSFAFRDFREAFGWMQLVADVADDADHHPEWFNVYNRVDVTLTTHDCDGLSLRDVNMAQAMDRLFTTHTTDTK